MLVQLETGKQMKRLVEQVRTKTQRMVRSPALFLFWLGLACPQRAPMSLDVTICNKLAGRIQAALCNINTATMGGGRTW